MLDMGEELCAKHPKLDTSLTVHFQSRKDFVFVVQYVEIPFGQRQPNLHFFGKPSASFELCGDVFKALHRTDEEGAVFGELLCQQLPDQAFNSLQGDLKPIQTGTYRHRRYRSEEQNRRNHWDYGATRSDKRGVRNHPGRSHNRRPNTRADLHQGGGIVGGCQKHVAGKKGGCHPRTSTCDREECRTQDTSGLEGLCRVCLLPCRYSSSDHGSYRDPSR